MNNAVVPLPTCQNGPGGSCPLLDFQAYVRKRGEVVGDFVQRCGLSNSTMVVPDIVDFYTNPESEGAHVSVIEVPVL